MKKKLASAFIASFLAFGFYAQLTYVPDNSFELYIETYIPGSSNGNLSDNYVNTAAIQNEGYLSLSPAVVPSGVITDFTGLEAFSSIHTMGIQNMNMTNIDLSNLYIVSSGGLWDFQISFQNNNVLENLILPQGGGIRLNLSDCISLKNIVYHSNNIIEGSTIIGSCPSLENFDISMVSFIKLQSQIWLANNSNLHCVNLKNGFCSNWSSVGITGNPLVNCVQVDNPSYCNVASGTIWNWDMHSIDPNYAYSTNCSCQVDLDELSNPQFQISPNPTSHTITIKGEKNMNQSFQIFDQMGREVFKGKLTGTETEVNLSALSKGMYMLKIEGNYQPAHVVKE
jgi:hypothetical protein